MAINRQDEPQKSWPPPWLPVLAIIVVACVWPVAGWYAQQAIQKSQNRIEDWLPASFAETQSLYRFVERFGSDEFLMISWEGCTFSDARAAALATRLTSPADDGVVYFQRATTADGALESLKDLTLARAKAGMQGIFIGADGKQTCIIALISEAGMQDRRSAVDWAWKASTLVTGLLRDEIHIAGTTADSVAVDEAASENILLLNAVSYLVCLAILVVSLKQFLLVATLFLCAVFSQHVALACIYLSNGYIDSVQLLVANLCFVLTISAGLHYLGYFREAQKVSRSKPALIALRIAWMPSLLAALTTALGFLSLCSSELVPIRSFGFYSAILVPINAFIVLAILSIHGKWTSSRRWYGKLIPESLETVGGSKTDQSVALFIIRIVRRAPRTIIIVWLIILIGFSFGVTKLKTSFGTHKLLSTQSKLVLDYEWLESRIGPLVPVEFVLKYDGNSSLLNTDYTTRLLALEQLRDRVLAIPEIESTLSVLNFIPSIPTERGAKFAARRGLIGKRISDAKGRFQDSRYLFEDEVEQSWRISGRVAGSKSVEYSDLLDRLQREIDEFLAEDQSGAITVEVGGGVPFIYRTQRQLLLDLLSSFSFAFISIAIAMALLFRSFSGGLLTMIPNVTPAAIVFGVMGWYGMEVELGTVLTASVMMGVCVDDTLHFITHFRESRKKGLSPSHAVDEAIQCCGGAIIQTAMVCGLGMLVFSWSSFVPVARFAWLTFALLFIGLLSDLILTPAMLLSPLHHLFYWEKRKELGPATNQSPSGQSVHEL